MLCLSIYALQWKSRTWCTLRRGEILGLCRRDLDLENGAITIRQTRDIDAKGSWIVKGPKSQAGYRTFAVPPSIIPLVRNHLDRFVDASRDALVLTDRDGEPLSPRSLQRAWTAARKKVEIPELHLHDLRHTGNTLAASTGASTKELMVRMGHSTPRPLSSISTPAPNGTRRLPMIWTR